jgi:peptidoglycan/xylan/chitin deacetylase (PgdA/CDA1 family)
MPGERREGQDHDLYEWSPIITRAPLKWPDNARVALAVILNLEHYDWDVPEGTPKPSGPQGGIGIGSFPDVRSFSHNEYGNRVGIFRLLNILDKYQVTPTIAMDATVAKNYPYLVQECQKRGADFIAHGITKRRFINSRMSEDEESQYVNDSIEALTNATGKRPVGWLGPEYAETMRTPSILASMGIQYVCDWPNDEQPYPMTVSSGEIYALPIQLPLDDVTTAWNRRIPVTQYGQAIRDAFDELYRNGESSGRTMVLNLHPWIAGQPYRSKYVDEALAYICKHDHVWKATTGEIIKWYKDEGR